MNRLLLTFLWTLAAASTAAAADVCFKKVPESLRKEVERRFPEYRIATSTDQRSGDDGANGGTDKPNACRTVVRGDFDGDKRRDVVLYLVEKKGTRPKLIAALSTRGRWSINELPQWNLRITGSYVKRAKRGVYKHTASFDFQPPDPLEREKLSTKHDGVMAGHVDASGVVYVYDGARWLYILVGAADAN